MKDANCLKAALMVLFALLFSLRAEATESPYDINLLAAPTINYDPFSGQIEAEAFRVRLDLSDVARSDRRTVSQQNRGRRLKLRIKPTTNSDFAVVNGIETLPLDVTPLGNARGFGRTATEVFQEFTVGNNLILRTFNFVMAVPASIYADPGNYVLPINIELLDVVSNAVLTSIETEIKVLVEVSLQSNIAGGSVNRNANSRFTLVDFGVLETGESQQISLQVRGNASANITLTSENDGRLQHTEDEQLFVNYSVDVDGEPSELEQPLQLIRAVDQTIQGSAYPIEIKIGDVGGSFSGSYRDIITVEVRPTLN